MANNLFSVANKMYKPTGYKKKDGMHRPEGAGNFDNMDDHNIVKSVSILQGTIQHTPVNPKDLANKAYVDASSGTETDPVFLRESGAFLTSYTETDPIFMALSGAFLTSYTETDPIFMALSGAFLTAYTETDPIWMAQSGAYLLTADADYQTLIDGSNADLLHSHAGLGAETDPVWLAQSGGFTTLAYTEILSGAYVTHSNDTSDPHGVKLTQTDIFSSGTISGANIINTGDHTTSGAAYCVGVITHTSPTPPTASNFPQGTLYVQYTA